MKDSLKQAVRLLRRSAAGDKCRSCGGFHGVLLMIEDYIPESARPPELTTVMALASASRLPVEVDCNGCKRCKPMEALKTLRGME